MRTAFEPHPISVDTPDHTTTTAFFRGECFVAEGVSLAIERAPEREVLAVDSIACSVGAEGDTGLVACRQAGYKGQVALRGFDKNTEALDAARRGLYKVPLSHERTQAIYEHQLQEMGFGVQASTEHGRPILRVDATPVRAGHDVAFVEHDIERSAPSGQANLRLVNNVLYYFRRPVAVQVLRRLCETLPDYGVIGLDAVTMSKPEWRDDLGGLMHDEFDMEPLFKAHRKSWRRSIPVLFGKPA